MSELEIYFKTDLRVNCCRVQSLPASMTKPLGRIADRQPSLGGEQEKQEQ
ncbi:hypothetical protein [Sporomusa acidovorans]|uniref:Uncharacterized protein n=1 Tax=Sporomusa acidovorans (strain ATCC 49682 / DSM 3132 / Mol) TaxID=1123286 RepID=A0ABZ3IZI4_SPOA4|nr:hypothetical protein [Sporomusa acidovorans]OZC14156.1 hypothetical protein SPACI_53310 [Sporomusa acidovorans DSM 3132]SDE69891.1 hypothetical protein SAMN04488499_101949 [Sporomusa acidovorans]